MLLGGGGVHDALVSLARDRDDWLIECAIIKAASEIDAEQKSTLVKAQAALVGNRVAELFGKMMGG